MIRIITVMGKKLRVCEHWRKAGGRATMRDRGGYHYVSDPSPFAKEMAAGCDAVINGAGHGGSSTPWTVRAAAELEALGRE